MRDGLGASEKLVRLQWKEERWWEPGSSIGQDPKPCCLGREELPSPAPAPRPSAIPLVPSLPAGGHPGDGRAFLRPLGALGHGDHQQQRPNHVQRTAAPAPGGRRLPREDGRQVRPRGHSRGGFTQFHGPASQACPEDGVLEVLSFGPCPCLQGERKMRCGHSCSIRRCRPGSLSTWPRLSSDPGCGLTLASG